MKYKRPGLFVNNKIGKLQRFLKVFWESLKTAAKMGILDPGNRCNFEEKGVEMALRTKIETDGQAILVGLRNDFSKYEKDICSGKIPCPFTVEFRNVAGNIVSRQPIPLTPAGKPKVQLFG